VRDSAPDKAQGQNRFSIKGTLKKEPPVHRRKKSEASIDLQLMPLYLNRD